MLIPELKLQMLQFVRNFYVVRERQIKKFFADWGTGEVEFALHDLEYKGQIVRHGQNHEYLSFVRQLPHPISEYLPCMDAIDVMAMLRSKEVVWFNRDVFPVEITFSTVDNKIYDVVVFDDFWMAKYPVVSRTRGQTLPPGEKDIVNHIAVVPSVDIAKKVYPLGFTLYGQVNPRDGFVDLYEITD